MAGVLFDFEDAFLFDGEFVEVFQLVLPEQFGSVLVFFFGELKNLLNCQFQILQLFSHHPLLQNFKNFLLFVNF